MDLFLSALLLVGGAFLVLWLGANTRKRDSEALDREVSLDFEEELDLSEPVSASDSPDKMEKLIEWLEEDDENDRDDEEEVFEIK